MSLCEEFPALLIIDMWLWSGYLFWKQLARDIASLQHCHKYSIFPLLHPICAPFIDPVQVPIPNLAPIFASCLAAAYIAPVFTGGRAAGDPEPEGGHLSLNRCDILSKIRP